MEKLAPQDVKLEMPAEIEERAEKHPMEEGEVGERALNR